MAFYLWALALIIVMGQTTRSVVEGNISVGEELLIAFGLLLCVCCSSGLESILVADTTTVSVVARH